MAFLAIEVATQQKKRTREFYILATMDISSFFQSEIFLTNIFIFWSNPHTCNDTFPPEHQSAFQ